MPDEPRLNSTAGERGERARCPEAKKVRFFYLYHAQSDKIQLIGLSFRRQITIVFPQDLFFPRPCLDDFFEGSPGAQVCVDECPRL